MKKQKPKQEKEKEPSKKEVVDEEKSNIKNCTKNEIPIIKEGDERGITRGQ